MIAALLLISTAIYATVPPFWQETFDTGFPAGWATFDQNNQGVAWNHCDDYRECPPASQGFSTCLEERFNSSPFDDGYLYVNSLAFQGLVQPHLSILDSKTVDCSGKAQVFLRFKTFLHALSFSPDINAVVQVKSGNGDFQTFVLFPKLNTSLVEASSLKTDNALELLLDISSVAANQPAVTIRWQWKGQTEVMWAIDDVELFDHNPLYDNVLWGETESAGSFDGSLNDWAVTNFLDSCKWVWQPDGRADTPDSGTKANYLGFSPSSSNGVAMMNPTFCTVSGNPEVNSYSELISPLINLASVPVGSRLAVRFWQAVAPGNFISPEMPLTSLSVSVDSGLSWMDTLDMNPVLPFGEFLNGEKSVSLPESVAGSSHVKLKFTFAGSSFIWMLDDVRIVQQWENDLAIRPTFFAVAPDMNMPLSQRSPVHFFADVENRGTLPQESATLKVQVRKDETGEIVYSDELPLGSIAPGEIVENAFFANTFLPTPEAANYTCWYTIAGGEPDRDETNNTSRWQFRVEGQTFAKDLGDCSISGTFTSSESILYEIGNCYFLPEGSDYCAESVTFAYFDLMPHGGTPLQVNLYQWKTDDTFGDDNGDTLANDDEFELIGSSTQFLMEGHDKVLVLDTQTLISQSTGDPCVQLEDSTYYFATVKYFSASVSNGQQVPFFIGASEEVNFAAMFWLSLQTEYPRYVSALRHGDDPDFRMNGWGLLRIPIVRLNLQSTSAADEWSEDNLSLVVAPNPADEEIQLKIPESLFGKDVRVEIFDICGRLADALQFENANVSRLPIRTGFLSNGTFILRVISEEQTGAAKFVISR